MSATPPAPAPASRPRPAAAWLAFSAQMTAQVAPVADRADLTVTVAPGAGRGAPACFVPASAEIEVNGDHLPVDPATADPADRERYPALWGATVHECAHAAHSRWRAPRARMPPGRRRRPRWRSPGSRPARSPAADSSTGPRPAPLIVRPARPGRFPRTARPGR
jgi:hypothetical protein